MSNIHAQLYGISTYIHYSFIQYCHAKSPSFRVDFPIDWNQAHTVEGFSSVEGFHLYKL